MTVPADVTQLLHLAHDGDVDAREELLQVLYAELHGRARRAMGRQAGPHTLQPTALLNEAYIRLVGDREEPWASRGHFLSVASRAMRQILIDHSRARCSTKRAARRAQDPIEAIAEAFEERAGDLEALDAALVKLAAFDPVMARVVELRFFGGMGMDEIAELLELKARTLDRRWAATRTWLAAEIR